MDSPEIRWESGITPTTSGKDPYRMSPKNHDDEPSYLLNEHQVAKQLNLSVATIRRWRLLRQGPKWLKLGSAVRYRPDDLQAYLNGRAA